MKRIVFLILCLCSVYVWHINLEGSSYQGYEKISLSSGKLLSDYTAKDYQTYYNKVNPLKFNGWRVYVVNDDVKATFITETLFSYYNDGYTPIEYEYKLERKKTSKLGLSATGNIGLKLGKDVPKFKNNLESALKLSADYTISQDEKESYHLKFKVDPGTQVDLYVYGEGKVTNGVAARYSLFIRVEKGGFEVFVVTTEYQRLEKKKI
jgi:hypothetical protein